MDDAFSPLQRLNIVGGTVSGALCYNFLQIAAAWVCQAWPRFNSPPEGLTVQLDWIRWKKHQNKRPSVVNKNVFSWIWDLTGWTPLSANELLVVEWREQTQQPSISTAVCLTLVCFGCFKLIPIHPHVLIHQIKAGYQNLAFLSFM